MFHTIRNHKLLSVFLSFAFAFILQSALATTSKATDNVSGTTTPLLLDTIDMASFGNVDVQVLVSEDPVVSSSSTWQEARVTSMIVRSKISKLPTVVWMDSVFYQFDTPDAARAMIEFLPGDPLLLDPSLAQDLDNLATTWRVSYSLDSEGLPTYRLFFVTGKSVTQVNSTVLSSDRPFGQKLLNYAAKQLVRKSMGQNPRLFVYLPVVSSSETLIGFANNLSAVQQLHNPPSALVSASNTNQVDSVFLPAFQIVTKWGGIEPHEVAEWRLPNGKNFRYSGAGDTCTESGDNGCISGWGWNGECSADHTCMGISKTFIVHHPIDARNPENYQASFDISNQLLVVEPLTLSSITPQLNEDVTARFKIKNDTGQALTFDLAAGARRGSDWNGEWADFPTINLTLQPGQDYIYQKSRPFASSGNYFAEPIAKVNGAWGGIAGANRVTFTIVGTPAPIPTTPSPSGGVTVISAWPQGDNLSPNQQFNPNVVVKTTGFSLNCTQDFLQNRDGNLYGTGTNQGCQALGSDQYRFYFNTAMKAPGNSGTFQSQWQIWHSPNLVGPVINLWFSTASSPSGPEGVYLCRNTDFSNNCMRFDVDNPNLGASGFGNDEAESIQINGDWSAVLYENNDYDGRREVFNGSDHDLIDNIVHRNDASSIRVRRRNPAIVTLYEHNSYGGQAFDSDRAINDLNHWNYNDIASSVRVASGYCVMLYEDGNFGGNSMEVCSDRTEVGGLDNRISSFAICNGHCPVPPTPTPIPTPTNTPFPAAAGDLLNSFEAGTDGLHINAAADNSATTIASSTEHATDGTKVAQLTFNHNSSIHSRAVYQYDLSPSRDWRAYDMIQFDMWANQPLAVALVLGTGPSYTWFEASSQRQLVIGNNTVQFNLKSAIWNGGGSNNVAVADLNDVRYLAFLVYPARDGQDSVYLDNLRLYPIQIAPTPTFTSTPLVTDTPTSTPSPTFSSTPLPTNTSTLLPTITPTPTNTPTPIPTVTNTSTATLTRTPVPFTPTALACTGRITGLALFDINAGQPVPSYNPIPNGATINLASLPSSFNVEAMTSGAVESVQFVVNGSTSLQNDPPYRLPDDTVTWNVTPGSYSINVTAFSQDNAGGIVCDTKNLTINFVTPTLTSTATKTPVSPTATSTPASTPTPTPTGGVSGVELLTQAWHLTGNNGAAEAYQSIPPTVLQGKNMLRITYNLHGLKALGGDASAIIFDQNGWQYISLSNYGKNGFNGVQTVDIPLSAFSGLNLNANVGTLHTRFWYNKSFVVDIKSIVAYASVNVASETTSIQKSYLPLILR